MTNPIRGDRFQPSPLGEPTPIGAVVARPGGEVSNLPADLVGRLG
ncbi:MAG: hypothetical protein WAQ75_07995 [Propionicimonas sp.]|mgnify:CR=1 FL=1